MKTNKTSQKERKQRQEKIKEAIYMVNKTCKLRIAPSEVHGVGVFAIIDIKKGERIYMDAMPQMLDIPYNDFKDLKPEIVELILDRFPLVVTGSQFMVHETLMQMYLNHSDKPNYDNKTGKTLRKIKKGEELFEDYKQIEDWEKVFKWLK